MKNICILIPAYNPTDSLVELFILLKKQLPMVPIVIVNDGSSSNQIFQKLKTNLLPPNIVINNPKNLGKGESLKVGFSYILQNFRDCKGVITADCDLQHVPDDIIRLVKEFCNDEQVLYLGSRFSDYSRVPLRSKIGNMFATKLIEVFYKTSISDTQTGLRALPIGFVKSLLSIKLSDFSFEMEMLIMALKNKLKIKEIPIQTVYISDNKSSNFKPIVDSYKICKTIVLGVK